MFQTTIVENMSTNTQPKSYNDEYNNKNFKEPFSNTKGKTPFVSVVEIEPYI